MGIAPGNTDGTYTQKVPLVGITANKDAKLELDVKGKKMSLGFGDDFVAWTKRVKERESVDAEMVFVGYGVVAPEYNWDDYKNVDVRGKVIVMLINDPPIPDPNDRVEARPEDVRRAGDDLLRQVDLQIRDSCGKGRGGRAHSPRDRACKLRLGCRQKQQLSRAVRSGGEG